MTDWIAGLPLWLQMPIVMICAIALCSVLAVVLLRMIDVTAAVLMGWIRTIAGRTARGEQPGQERQLQTTSPHFGHASASQELALQELEREADRA